MILHFAKKREVVEMKADMWRRLLEKRGVNVNSKKNTSSIADIVMSVNKMVMQDYPRKRHQLFKTYNLLDENRKRR